MKHYRLTIEVDILARDSEHATRRSGLLCQDIENRRWVEATKLECLYERNLTSQKKETP